MRLHRHTELKHTPTRADQTNSLNQCKDRVTELVYRIQRFIICKCRYNSKAGDDCRHGQQSVRNAGAIECFFAAQQCSSFLSKLVFHNLFSFLGGLWRNNEVFKENTSDFLWLVFLVDFIGGNLNMVFVERNMFRW